MMDKNPYLPGTPEEYIQANMGLAQLIAWKFFRASKDRDIDDLVGIAYHGLVKSYQRFDPTNRLGIDAKPIKFSTYAGSMIKGYIMTYLRQVNRPIHLGRRGIDLIAKINIAGLNGNETIQEIAIKAGISVDDANEAVMASIAANPDTLERKIAMDDGGGHVTLADMIGEKVESNDDQETIKDFTAQLTPRLYEVYKLRMVEELSQLEASKVMGFTQSYFCRLEAKLMEVARQYGSKMRLAGGIKSINEEEEIMSSIEQRENSKKLRGEITTIEQFESIGSYAEVAKKYLVSVATSHALKMSLKDKKVREDDSFVPSPDPSIERKAYEEPILEEIVQVHPEVEIQVTPEEVSSVEEKWCLSPEGIEEARNMSKELLYDKRLDDPFIEPEPLLVKKERTSEELLRNIKSDIRELHKMHTYRSEMRFQAQLRGLIEEC